MTEQPCYPHLRGFPQTAEKPHLSRCCNNGASDLSQSAPSFATNQLRTNSTNQMKNKKIKWTTAGTVASVAFCAGVAAQSSDALLDKLVQKGVLTAEEAKELRNETKKDFDKNYRKETSMPDWVTS